MVVPRTEEHAEAEQPWRASDMSINPNWITTPATFNADGSTTYGDAVDLTDGDMAPAPRTPFIPGYERDEARILRARLYADEGGVATATFDGTLDADGLWIERSRSGMKVYAEVTPNADGAPELQTTLLIAVVPTGKRVPTGARRLGSDGRGTHAYLLAATVGPKPEPEAADPAPEDSDDFPAYDDSND